MSLINDALKRAEAEKTSQAQFRRIPQQPNVPNNKIPRPRTWPAITIAALVLAGVTTWAGWTLFSAPTVGSNPLAPRRATAAGGVQVELPDMQQPLPITSEVLDDTSNLQETASQQQTIALAGKLLKRFAGAILGGAIDEKPEATVDNSPDVQSENIAVEESAQPSSPINVLSRYRLTGVIRGPAGVSAVINNKIVEPGQMIDGAKLISTGPTSVMLEIDGKLYRLRL